MKKIGYLAFFALLTACASRNKTTHISKNNQKDIHTPLLNQNTFVLNEISKDKKYGLSEHNPIEVGGVDKSEGPLNERRFLNALAGPNGEKVSYYRLGSCCPIKSNKALFGDKVMLDNYRVTWEGSTDTVSIYINMYDYGELKAPVGFTIKYK